MTVAQHNASVNLQLSETTKKQHRLEHWIDLIIMQSNYNSGRAKSYQPMKLEHVLQEGARYRLVLGLSIVLEGQHHSCICRTSLLTYLLKHICMTKKPMKLLTNE